MGVGLLSLEIQRSCQTSQQASVLAKERRFQASSAPASQTLILPPLQADTILVPLWLKPTELTILKEPFGANWASPSLSDVNFSSSTEPANAVLAILLGRRALAFPTRRFAGGKTQTVLG